MQVDANDADNDNVNVNVNDNVPDNVNVKENEKENDKANAPKNLLKKGRAEKMQKKGSFQHHFAEKLWKRMLNPQKFQQV